MSAFFALLLCLAARAIGGASAIPTPSGPQLKYQSTDFVALIHFNMATFARNGDPGCAADNWNVDADYAAGRTNDPATFSPASLNTTQWFDSISAVGAKIAVVTAKHGCGFLLWPTEATLPDGEPYRYGADYDLLRRFVASADAAGVGYGFYYSIMKNFYLCRGFSGTNICGSDVLPGQLNVTDEAYLRIVRQHVTELWSNYGALTEIWVDSHLLGFADLMVELQPTAAGTPAHPRGWCGTETGQPSRDVGGGPIWQTGEGYHGDADSDVWVDKFCDPQLFRRHSLWFWEPNQPVRTLEEMIPIYHDIVGRGMVMELAFGINRDGLVAPDHEAVYRRLGAWVESCYGRPVATMSGRGETTLKLPIPSDAGPFDRIMIQEDIALGQRIRNYTVAINGLVVDGTSVGRKRIHLLPERQSATEVTLVITAAIAPPQIQAFSVFGPCFPETETLTKTAVS